MKRDTANLFTYLNMKDNNKNKRGVNGHHANDSSERDKTSFEKFEDDVKGIVFNVLYILLKDSDSSRLKVCIMGITDLMQIYWFSFAAVVSGSLLTIVDEIPLEIGYYTPLFPSFS